MKGRYYVNIEKDGPNKGAYLKAFSFANNIAKKDKEIKRIVCYIHTKDNIGYFEQLFPESTIKSLLKGNEIIEPMEVPLTIATQKTYEKNMHSSDVFDLVLAFGMDLKDLEVIDDYSCVKYIVAIPWIKKKTMPWVERWKAIEISNKTEESISPDLSLSPIAKEALNELTEAINVNTGIIHPMDNALAKTYIRTLHKYDPLLNSEAVKSYLTRDLNWSSASAKEVANLVTILNEGRYFQGGEKTGLKNYYKKWQDAVKNKE